MVGDNGGNTLYSKDGNKVLEGLGGADVFHFAGAWVSGTKVDRILDLDFGERDVMVFRGYDSGTFVSAPGLVVFDGGRAATVDSLADLRALVTKSADVTSRSGGGGTEVLRIAQDGSAHENPPGRVRSSALTVARAFRAERPMRFPAGQLEPIRAPANSARDVSGSRKSAHAYVHARPVMLAIWTGALAPPGSYHTVSGGFLLESNELGCRQPTNGGRHGAGGRTSRPGGVAGGLP